MSSPFAAPGTASGIDFKTLNGRLLLIEPSGVEAGIKTSFGEKEAVRATVTVLDGPDAGEEYNDALIFPGVLIGQLRGRIGQKVLGRLAQGNAKPGQQPPWKLEEATAADQKIGLAHLSGSLAAPAAGGSEPPF